MPLIYRSMRFACCVITLGLCSCASGPTAHELHEIGTPQVAFLQPAGDVVIFNLPSSISPSDLFSCLMLVSLPLCADYQADAAWHDRQDMADEKGQLTQYAEDIKTLRFNDRAYALASSVISDIGWLPDKTLHRVPWPRDASFYTKQNFPSSVLYIQPLFALSKDGQDFYVYVIAGIQKTAPGYPHGIYNFRRQDFAYTHHLTLTKPGMSWQQQKDLAHQVASMHPDQAIQAWFTDDAALMKADFAEDMKQLDRGLREFFGAKEAGVAGAHGQ